MSITPLDIHNKKFSKRFKGYDEDEVNTFLDQVIKDYEMSIREANEYQAEVKRLEERLGHFDNIETTLNKSILVAQEAAEEVKANARKESKLIIKEAEKNADRIINEALSKSRQIYLEIEELKKEGKVFRTRLRSIVEAQLDLIGSEDWDELFNTDVGEDLELTD